MHGKILIFLAAVTLLLTAGCSANENGNEVLFSGGQYPQGITVGDSIYFTRQCDPADIITIYAATAPEDLPAGRSRVVADCPSMGIHHVYSPEIHKIGDKWYVYFEGDSGNTDTHQLYVLENSAKSPMQGEWTLHGPIITNDEWNFGLHPTVFENRGKLYMLWSGWAKRRVESETQCIFIAEMENPWTLGSKRVLISSPQYEWERQWINPDGSRTAYPIFVNENPEVLFSPDGKRVVVVYSASGIWTVFSSLGMLYADTDSDLLNPASWTKMKEPQFVPAEGSPLMGASNISVITLPGGKEQLMFYQAKYFDDQGNTHPDIYMKPIGWNSDNLPEFGHP